MTILFKKKTDDPTMTYAQAQFIRSVIVENTPQGHKARNISKRVMQSLANEREDVAHIIGGQHHLARDHEIDERYATQLRRAYGLMVDYVTRDFVTGYK